MYPSAIAQRFRPMSLITSSSSARWRAAPVRMQTSDRSPRPHRERPADEDHEGARGEEGKGSLALAQPQLHGPRPRARIEGAVRAMITRDRVPEVVGRVWIAGAVGLLRLVTGLSQVPIARARRELAS